MPRVFVSTWAVPAKQAWWLFVAVWGACNQASRRWASCVHVDKGVGVAVLGFFESLCKLPGPCQWLPVVARSTNWRPCQNFVCYGLDVSGRSCDVHSWVATQLQMVVLELLAAK